MWKMYQADVSKNETSFDTSWIYWILKQTDILSVLFMFEGSQDLTNSNRKVFVRIRTDFLSNMTIAAFVVFFHRNFQMSGEICLPLLTVLHQELHYRFRKSNVTCSSWYRIDKCKFTLKFILQLIFRNCVSTGHQDFYREWQYHMLHVYNYVLLKMNTWCPKHVEENSILCKKNNNQCIKLVINV